MAQGNFNSLLKSEFVGFLKTGKARNTKNIPVSLILAALIFNTPIGGNVSAQVIPDNTLGAENSTIEPNVDFNGISVDLIKGGAVRKGNLFHSFEKFNVREGQGVYFENPTGVQGILSRVTGSSSTNILGKLGVLGNADLFLINPNGIIFGQNASLDLKGSFLATTANQLSFADGTVFSAKAPQSLPLLTITTPVGLEFGGTNGDIINLSQAPPPDGLGLRVQPGKTLALVGGNISFYGGFLTAPAGRLELGSVGNGQVSLQSSQAGWKVKYDDVQNFLDIELNSVQQQVGSFSAPLNIPSIIDVSGDGGDAQVHGRSVVLKNGTQIRGTGVNTSISVTASESVEIIGTSPEPIKNRSGLVSATASAGDAGDITVTTGRLIVKEGGFIFAESAKEVFPDGQSIVATGNGGNLTITASDLVLLTDKGSSLQTGTQGPGDAGQIMINTKQLQVINGAQISTATSGSGKASNITVTADDLIRLSGFDSGLFAKTDGSGIGGEINIFTQQFQIMNNAHIDTSTISVGKGGNIFVQADNFEASSAGQLLTTTSGARDAGDIALIVRDALKLTGNNSGLFANTTPNSTGNAGSIFIDPQVIAIQNGAAIKVNSQGNGQGGDIDLQAGNLRLDRGTISAASTSGTGGNIKLSIKNLLLLRKNSEISATARNNGNGGNIIIDTDLLLALENSDITANAFNGRGGNIRITTRGLFLTPDSKINASSKRGIDGVVEINNPEVDPSDSLTELPETVESPQEIAQGCRPGQALGGSTFVHVGRGGLPSSPNELQTPSVVWQDLRVDSLQAQASIPSKTDPSPASLTPTSSVFVEAKGWSNDSQGRVRLTAHPSKVSPGSQRLTSTC